MKNSESKGKSAQEPNQFWERIALVREFAETPGSVECHVRFVAEGGTAHCTGEELIPAWIGGIRYDGKLLVRAHSVAFAAEPRSVELYIAGSKVADSGLSIDGFHPGQSGTLHWPVGSSSSPYDMRKKGTPCGPAGKLFEPKPQKAAKVGRRSWWARWMGGMRG